MKQRILQSKLLEDSDVSLFFLLWSVLSWQAQETITKPIAIQWIIPRHRTFLFGPQHPLMSLPPCSRVSHCAFLLSPEHPLLSSSLVHDIPSRLPPQSRASPRAFLFGPQHPLMPYSLIQAECILCLSIGGICPWHHIKPTPFSIEWLWHPCLNYFFFDMRRLFYTSYSAASVCVWPPELQMTCCSFGQSFQSQEFESFIFVLFIYVILTSQVPLTSH